MTPVDPDAEAAAPLADTTVLELGHIVAGPFCSLLLADLGAEVVKVEHPTRGEALRDSSPMGNSQFNCFNRNKRSVTLDLKADAGREVFLELVAEADVVVENYSPGTTDRLGVGYEDCRAVNPGLVYCSIKGFGAGPYEAAPALDPVCEALAGLMSTTGREGDPPTRAGTSIADMTASFYGALGVLGALRRRDRTGEGDHVVAPMFEGTVSLMGGFLSYTQAYDRLPDRLGGGGQAQFAPYDTFRTGDDEWVFVGPSSDRHFRALCDGLDLDLADDDRFRTNADRRANADALAARLTDRLADMSREEFLDRLDGADVPVAPVNDMRDVVSDPHLTSTGALREIRNAEGTDRAVLVPRSPLAAAGYEPPPVADPPGLGADTDEVLESIGLSAERIASLRRDGTI